MNVLLMKDTFSSSNGKTYYVVRYCLCDKDNNLLRKGEIVLWLTKEQYDAYNI